MMVPVPAERVPLELVVNAIVYIAAAPAEKDEGDAVTAVTVEAYASGIMTANDTTREAVAPNAILRILLVGTLFSYLELVL